MNTSIVILALIIGVVASFTPGVASFPTDEVLPEVEFAADAPAAAPSTPSPQKDDKVDYKLHADELHYAELAKKAKEVQDSKASLPVSQLDKAAHAVAVTAHNKCRDLTVDAQYQCDTSSCEYEAQCLYGAELQASLSRCLAIREHKKELDTCKQNRNTPRCKSLFESQSSDKKAKATDGDSDEVPQTFPTEKEEEDADKNIIDNAVNDENFHDAINNIIKPDDSVLLSMYMDKPLDIQSILKKLGDKQAAEQAKADMKAKMQKAGEEKEHSDQCVKADQHVYTQCDEAVSKNYDTCKTALITAVSEIRNMHKDEKDKANTKGKTK